MANRPGRVRRRGCIFCGGTPLTKEHVLPKWLKPIVPFDATTGILSARQPDTIPIPPSEREARAVCGPCNHGWMSNLEKRAKPLLTPLILGKTAPREIGVDGLSTIAFWAAKTVLTCQFVNPPDQRFVPEAACHEIRENQAPAVGTHVWIAPHVGDLWAAFYYLEPLGIWTVHATPEVDEHGRVKVNSYTATLGLGHLLIHVLYFAGVEIPLKDDVLASFQSIRRIWPDPYAFTWPPGPPLSNREASELAGAIPRGVPGMDEVLNRKPYPAE